MFPIDHILKDRQFLECAREACNQHENIVSLLYIYPFASTTAELVMILKEGLINEERVSNIFVREKKLICDEALEKPLIHSRPFRC